MKKSIIDIGSNSLLLLVGDKKGSQFIIDENELRITGLGKNLDQTRAFSAESMERTFEVLAEYRSLIEKHHLSPKDTIIVATEAARVSLNADEFFTRVKRE